MKPSLGRIVHYVETRPDQAGIEKAALISGINEDLVDLHIFQPLSLLKHDGPPYEPVIGVGRVPFSDERTPGSWHWPEREG